MTGQVAAVDRRDVRRVQRAQVLGRVPVVEVPVELRQAAHRCERGLEALDGGDRPGPAEVPRSDGRQQVEADVGRRGTTRDDRPRILLEVVGRQPVMRGRHEGLEVAPGAPRDHAQVPLLVGIQQLVADHVHRPADAHRDQRRDEPQQHARQQQRPGARREPGRRERQHRDQRGPAAHGAIEADGIEPRRPRRLRGRGPFEQVAARDEHAHERAHDRVECVPRAVGEEREGQHELQAREVRVGDRGREVVAERHALGARQQREDRWQEHRQRQGGQEHRARRERGVHRQERAERERGERRRCDRRPPQVVRHLPAAVGRHRQRAGEVTCDPRQQLPVAPGPAVLALRVDVVACRKLVDHLDIRREARAREDAFEEVVAEQRVVAHPSCHRRLERVDVVDALAGERAFAEQVLVHVGRGRCVGVDARRAGEDLLVPRAVAAERQRRCHARLQDRVAVDDPLPGDVEARRVDRMGHLADQPQRGVARQARVAVERDDEAHVGGHVQRLAADAHEGRVARTAQQAVELLQLAALAFPAHPALLAVAEHATAMQQHEARAGGARGMSSVEAVHLGRREGEDLFVAVEQRGVRVRPVGQQREVEVAFRAGQEVHLEALDLLAGLGVARQQRRDHDQRAQARRNAVEKVEPGQR